MLYQQWRKALCKQDCTFELPLTLYQDECTWHLLLGTTIRIMWCTAVAVCKGSKQPWSADECCCGKREKTGMEWAMKIAHSQSLMAHWRFYILNLRMHPSLMKFTLKHTSCHNLTLCRGACIYNTAEQGCKIWDFYLKVHGLFLNFLNIMTEIN